MAFPRQRIFLPSSSWLDFFKYYAKHRLMEGDKIGAFERAFAKFIGAAEAIAIPSGRAGLKFILEGLRLEPGAEIIVPAYTYPIVPFVIKALGFPLKFVDIELTSLGLDAEKLDQAVSKNTKAIIVTHLFGVPCDIRKILSMAKSKNIEVIEDCAHSCGAEVGGTKAGAFGRAAYFSFETSKCINTLGGGMITTPDTELATRIRAFRDEESQGAESLLVKRLLKSSFEAVVTYPPLFTFFVSPVLRLASVMKGSKDVMGTGYVGSDITLKGRMGRYSNYQAHLGLEQLNDLVRINGERTQNAMMLMEALEGHAMCHRPLSPEDRPNYLLFSVLVPQMEEVALRLLKMGVDTKRYYMRNCGDIYGADDNFPNAARAEREVLHLPSYPGLSKADIEEIADKVKDVVGSVK